MPTVNRFLSHPTVGALLAVAAVAYVLAIVAG